MDSLWPRSTPRKERQPASQQGDVGFATDSPDGQATNFNHRITVSSLLICALEVSAGVPGTFRF